MSWFPQISLPTAGGIIGWYACRRAARGAAWRASRDASLASGNAHVTADGRPLVAAIDKEVVSLGLARHGLADRGDQRRVAFRCAHGRAKVGGVFLAEAHVKRAGTGQPHAVAGFTEVVGHRRDES